MLAPPACLIIAKYSLERIQALCVKGQLALTDAQALPAGLLDTAPLEIRLAPLAALLVSA